VRAALAFHARQVRRLTSIGTEVVVFGRTIGVSTLLMLLLRSLSLPWRLLSTSLLLTACGGDDPAEGGPLDDGSGDADVAGDGSADGDATGEFPAVTDFAAPGPYATTEGPNPTNCTIHRPMELGADGLKHPVILWGNGTFATPAIYAEVLSHWASHGFIVAAANTGNAGSGAEMLACLDYLTEQDGVAESPYFGKVELTRVGSSGHSQGGAGSIMAGRDARVSVTAPLQPYINAIPGGGAFDQGAIGAQTGPMFLMSGSEDTIAQPAPNQQPVFDGTNVPVFWGTLLGADHLASATADITGYRGPATAWFRLHLMDDESARALFYGESCGLCTDAGWEVQSKELD
jgi:hypothetical protein